MAPFVSGLSWGLGAGICLFVAIGGGIWAGSYMAARTFGDLVDQSLTAVENVAYKLLSNRTLQDLIKAADKIPNVGGKGGIMDRLASAAGRFLGA